MIINKDIVKQDYWKGYCNGLGTQIYFTPKSVEIISLLQAEE